MTTPFDRDVPGPESEPHYVPSPALLDLISDIANEPALDSRLWCGVTMAINMDVLRPTSDAEDLVLDIVGNALASGTATDSDYHLTRNADGQVVDVDFDDVHGPGDLAELILAIMKIEDVDARRVALEALIVPYARDDHAGVAVVESAIRRFISWVEEENRTRH